MPILSRGQKQKRTVLDFVGLIVAAIGVSVFILLLVSEKVPYISIRIGQAIYVFIVSIVGSVAYSIDYDKQKPLKIRLVRIGAAILLISVGLGLLLFLGHFNWINFPANAINNFIYVIPLLLIAEIGKTFAEMKVKKYLKDKPGSKVKNG